MSTTLVREMLIACYLSGQMSERQWQAHLRDDPDLAKALADRRQ